MEIWSRRPLRREGRAPEFQPPTLAPAKMVHQSRLLLRQFPDPAVGAVDRPRPADASISPRGWKRLEADGVGLAIVAALDRRSGENPANVIVSTASSRATSPIYIATPSWTCNGSSGRFATAVCASGSSRAREMDFCSPAIDGEFGGFQVADFLSRCYLCRKKLHGKDIYMYK